MFGFNVLKILLYNYFCDRQTYVFYVNFMTCHPVNTGFMNITIFKIFRNLRFKIFNVFSYCISSSFFYCLIFIFIYSIVYLFAILFFIQFYREVFFCFQFQRQHPLHYRHPCSLSKGILLCGVSSTLDRSLMNRRIDRIFKQNFKQNFIEFLSRILQIEFLSKCKV